MGNGHLFVVVTFRRQLFVVSGQTFEHPVFAVEGVRRFVGDFVGLSTEHELYCFAVVSGIQFGTAVNC